MQVSQWFSIYEAMLQYMSPQHPVQQFALHQTFSAHSLVKSWPFETVNQKLIWKLQR